MRSARAPVEEMDFPGAQPQGGAGGIHRGVAAADDHHPAAPLPGACLRWRPARKSRPYQTRSRVSPPASGAGSCGSPRPGRPRRNPGAGPPTGRPGPAGCGDAPSAPSLRSGPPPGPAPPGAGDRRGCRGAGRRPMGFGFEERHLIALQAELIGSHEARRGRRPPRRRAPAWPEQGRLARRLRGPGRPDSVSARQWPGPAQRPAGAGRLAGAGADTAQDAGEGAAFQHHRQGLGWFAFPQEAELVSPP